MNVKELTHYLCSFAIAFFAIAMLESHASAGVLSSLGSEAIASSGMTVEAEPFPDEKEPTSFEFRIEVNERGMGAVSQNSRSSNLSVGLISEAFSMANLLPGAGWISAYEFDVGSSNVLELLRPT